MATPSQASKQALKLTVIAECSTSRARASLMELPHANVETPVFMPVGTQGKPLPNNRLLERRSQYLS